MQAKSAIPDLPIAALIGRLREHLTCHNNALIIAPPGAGKSTFLPNALLREPWARDGLIVLLQPRRVAVRAVAGQLARLSGAPVGDVVGYQMRDEVRRSKGTRLLVMTQGVLRRMLLADPELSGVSAVVFDEYHERSLDSDLCLALCRDTQLALREDLKLIVMSATLDAESIAPALQNFRLFESEGRTYPIDTRYLAPRSGVALAAHMTTAVGQALSNRDGSVLCFLPGQAEIRRCMDAIGQRYGDRSDVVEYALYGSQSDADQLAALAPPAPGQRKVILATDIAETSLTVPGVHSVIDSGLRRAPRFDARLGLTTLIKERAGRDRLDQRRGRAGRLAPGLCIRLWPEPEMRGIPAISAPDIDTQDLTDLVLACADWGVSDLSALPWTTAPPAAETDAARKKLEGLGLMSPDGSITAAGRLAAQLPMSVDLAAMAIQCAHTPNASAAVSLAVLLSDGARPGRGCIDLQDALHRLEHMPAARDRRLLKRRDKILAALSSMSDQKAGEDIPVWQALVESRPQLLAKARGGAPGAFKLAAGRGAFVDAASPLDSAEYLIVGGALLAGQDVRIASAWPLTAQQVDAYLGAMMTRERTITQSDASGRPQVRTRRKIGSLVIREHVETIVPGRELAHILLRNVTERGLEALPWPKAFEEIRARARFAAAHGCEAPSLEDDVLLGSAEVWLIPLLEKAPRLSALDGGAMLRAVLALQDYQQMQALDRFAPTQYRAPAGIDLKIDYSAAAGPSVAAKLQAFFGAASHPCVGNGRVPLVITMLSPAGRPLQLTTDLPGFWAGSYGDVRRDMRGRYPKHPWPENPAQAAATLYTKARDKRG